MPSLLKSLSLFVPSLTDIWASLLRIFTYTVALFNPPRDQHHRNEAINIDPDILYRVVAMEEGRFLMVPASKTTPIGARERNMLHVYFFGITGVFGAVITLSFAVNDPRTMTLYKATIPFFFAYAGCYVFDDLISPVTRLWRRRLVYLFEITAIIIVAVGAIINTRNE